MKRVMTRPRPSAENGQNAVNERRIRRRSSWLGTASIGETWLQWSMRPCCGSALSPSH